MKKKKLKSKKVRVTKTFGALAAQAHLLSEDNKRELTATILRELMVAARQRIQQVEKLLGIEFQIDTTVVMSETDSRQLRLTLEKSSQEK